MAKLLFRGKDLFDIECKLLAWVLKVIHFDQVKKSKSDQHHITFKQDKKICNIIISGLFYLY